MGNIRQKAKNRSSIAKVRQKPKSKKKIVHNPIIAANWNQKETFAQNYRRLGLAASLNDSTGGTENQNVFTADSDDEDQLARRDGTSAIKNGLGIKRSKQPSKLDVTETRVVRDPETGAIISVIDEPRRANPLNDPLNELESDTDDGDDGMVWSGFVNEHGALEQQQQQQGSSMDSLEGQTDVVRRLVAEATAPRVKRVRQQSEREQEWIRSLVDKHGDDYEGMFRDRLNVYQQSVGDIKRRVKKWRAAGGA